METLRYIASILGIERTDCMDNLRGAESDLLPLGTLTPRFIDSRFVQINVQASFRWANAKQIYDTFDVCHNVGPNGRSLFPVSRKIDVQYD